MADLDLPATGKDTSISIQLDGAQIAAYDNVGFDAEPVFETATTEPLGTTERRIDPICVGWKGTMELAVSSRDSDEFLDLVLAAGATRTPALITIVERTTYRDLRSKTYVYPDVKITGAPKTVKRGETTKLRISWETGMQRIAA